MKVLITIGLMTVATGALADVKLPVLKTGSQVYSNVTILNANATDIYFIHARGMGNAKLKDLEPDLQKRFRYDAAKASSAEQKQVEANAAYRKELMNAKAVARAKTRAPAQTPERAVTTADIPVREIHARSFLGRPAPRLVVEKWLTAQPDYEGRFLLVDFWATWCGPCRRSIPNLNALHDKFKDRLVIVGLTQETETEVRRMSSPRIDYFVATDTTGTTERAVEVRGIPHALLIDPNGIVRFEGHPGYLKPDAVAGLVAKYSP